ncbi:MAG TPA: response regulator, partial [Bacteroidia bacterium]|nr:response regulator [Bacteroidia bacterium]
MYQVVIVDDEVPQQESLTDMLQKNFPEYTIVKICSSVDEGKEYLEKNKVDLVFLDVIMPPSNGFELLKQLSNIC